MKRSEINKLVNSATACFEAHGWTLPPEPRWDVTDFGLGDWRAHGLACAVSGYFVRNGHSATHTQLIEFMHQWANGTLDSKP
jgi:D-lyxose ketol-isomerase